MPYVVSFQYIRPDNSVVWPSQHSFDEEISGAYFDMLMNDYHDKKTKTIVEIDDNTLEVEFIWQDKETYDEFSNRTETINFKQLISDYMNSVGIIVTKDEFEI